MWWGTEPDPGGSDTAAGPSDQQELSELKDQSEQQQKLIAQLKDMVRKTDLLATSAASLEKAEKLTSTLSKMQSRAKKNKQKKLLERDDDKGQPEGKIQVDTPGKEKVNLLRKQVEENRARLAERDKHQKGIEHKVTQLKAQLDDSQALVNQSLSNMSFTKDVKVSPTKSTYSLESSNEELCTIITEKDHQISELHARIEQLEANVLDLQENLKEKDSVIEARTKAITLLSDDLSRRGKATLDMLDETKEQMRLMQNNFVALEDEMKCEKQRILADLELKSKQTSALEEEVATLKMLNEQLATDNRLFSEQLAEKDTIVLDLQTKLNEASPKTTNKKGAKKGKAKDVDQVETLQKENINLKEQILNLEKQGASGAERSEEVDKLTKQLDEMNKSMIKLKAQNKSRIKELQKQVDLFRKTDDVHAELLKIHAENNKLKQAIAELEEEKGNLQLNLVDYDAKSDATDMHGGLVAELKQKLEALEQEVVAKETLTSTIRVEKDQLATEMENRQTELNTLQHRLDELSQMEAEHVKTQMTSAHLEEQIDQLKSNNEDLTQQVAVISKENIALHERIEVILHEKQEINTKLENLIHENIDLVDRLEKLSAEKVSSAESIEIVESLTQQEKLEIEEFNQKYSEPDVEGIHELEQNPELNDSVTKLTEESAELMEKIELFTIERKEVMEKMENLTVENTQLSEKIKLIEQEKLQLEETYETLFDSKAKIEQQLDELKTKSPGGSNLDEQIAYYKHLVSDQEREIGELKDQLTKNQQLFEELGIEKATVESTLQEIIKEKDAITQLLTENVTKMREYDQKITENTSLIHSLNAELNEFNTKIQQAEVLLREKDQYIAQVEEAKNNKDVENHKLKAECENKTQQIQNIIADFQNKYRDLEAKIQSSTPLQNEIENLQTQCTALDSTNKEQLQRMKKIAAHLKKKSAVCDEMEAELESHKKIIATNAQELDGARIQIAALSADLETTRSSSAAQINELTARLEELSRKLTSEDAVHKLQEELRTKDQLLDAQRAKQQEQEMIIENIEQEKNRYFNKNSELAEALSLIQNENHSLQVTIRNISEQLQEKIESLEESSTLYKTLEDELQTTKLQSAHLQQKIDELTAENQELLEANRTNQENVHTLQHQLNVMDAKYEQEYSDKLETLEDVNKNLQSEVAHLGRELNKVHGDLELEREQLEKIEYESSMQYEEFNNERKRIMEANERQMQEVNHLKVRLNELESENKCLLEQNKELNQLNDEEVQKLQAVIDSKHLEIEQHQVQLNEYTKHISGLNEQIHSLQSQVDSKPQVEAIAEQQVTSSLQSQVETVAEQHVASIVQMAEASVLKHAAPPNTEQDLHAKIKTLQFMLHDSEKSKEDVLEICQELLNEITWRDYETNKKQTELKGEAVSPETLQAIESEIVTQEEPTLQTTHVSEAAAPPGATEELITCKKAYKCFTADESLVLDSEENLWGSEEAQLEDVHIQNSNAAKIKEMEIERDRMTEEIKTLQVRSNKMLKKLKEFKEKNDQLTNQLKQNTDNFDELNEAIQDELKSQITVLEKQIQEFKNEREQQEGERKNLQRQVEALTAANERQLEKQTMEMQMLQAKNRELSEKVNQLEWGDDETPSEPSPRHGDANTSLQELQTQITELNARVADLSIDNEEMQCLLEEQVGLRKEAEQKLAELRVHTDAKQLWDDYNLLVQEKNNLALELKNIKAGPELERNELVDKYNALLKDSKDLEDELRELHVENKSLNQEVGQMRSKTDEVERNLAEIRSQQVAKETEIQELKNQLDLQQTIALETDFQAQQLEQIRLEKNDLQTKLDGLTSWKAETEQKLAEISAKDKEIQELKTQMDIQQAEALETLQTSMAAWAAEVDKRGADVAESWKIHVDKREYEFSQVENMLRNEIVALEAKYSTLLEHKTETEIQQSDAIHERQMLSQSIVSLQTKLAETEALVQTVDTLKEENQKLAESVAELKDQVMYYKNELESATSITEVKDAQIQQLSHEVTQSKEKLHYYEGRLNEMHQDNDEMSRLNEAVETLQRSLKEHEIQVQTLNVALNMKDEHLGKLQNDISTRENELIEKFNVEIVDLKRLIAEAEEKCAKLSEEKQLVVKENENYVESLKRMENHQEAVQNELSVKTEEYNDLRQQWEPLNEEISRLNGVIEISRNDAINLQMQVEEKRQLIAVRDNDLINLQIQLDEKSQQIVELTQVIAARERELQALQAHCTELESKVAELDYIVNEDTKQMSDLKDIIESQVLKIEKLKTPEVAETEATVVPEKHVHFPETELVTQHYYERQADSAGDQLLDAQEMDSGSELVSKAELELALYMLHQRDVRCEELTVELMQLVEERDILQLRLSNSIRMNEEFRRKISPRKLKDSDVPSTSIDNLLDTTDQVLSTPVRKSKTSDILIGAAGAEIAKEAVEEQGDASSSHTEEMTYLENKLSELQSVDHRRDVRLKDEKEARHLQLSLIQQHRDLSMLPAEAAARLVDANYTLSRESESASTVLLNWLWGKSTPKVNHL